MAKKQLMKWYKSPRFTATLAFVEKYWWVWVIVAVVVTYALIMLLARGQSIWFDEGYSITIARRSVAQLLALTAVDAHPPTYYLLLKLWGSLFHWDEFALRSLSALAASATVGVMLLLIRRMFTTRVALVALPFLVLSPFFLRYGYEVRMYALVGLIGVLATYVLIKAVESQYTKWWVIYGLLVALGMYTLYMSVVIWLAHVTWLAIRTIRLKQSLVRQKWMMAYIGAVVLFLPYLTTFLFQMTHSALPGIGSALTIDTLGGVLGMIISFVPSWQIGGLLSLLLLVVLGLGIYLTIFIWKKSVVKQRDILQLLLFCFFVPLVFYMLVSLLPKPFFIDRYMAHIVIFIYVLMGIITALAWRYGKQVVAILFGGLTIILLSIGVSQLQKTGNFNFERLQYPMTAAERQLISCNDQTVIVADDPYTYIDASYYFGGCNLRFESESNVGFAGGYAPLHDSPLRVTNATMLDSAVLYHLHWVGDGTSYKPSSRYHLVSSTTLDKQVVDRYELRVQ